MQLSNVIIIRLDDLLNSSDKKDFICCYQRKNRIIDHSKIGEKALRKNRVVDHSEIMEEVTKKNRITSYFKMEEQIESVNGDMVKISFFYWGIIKYNW